MDQSNENLTSTSSKPAAPVAAAAPGAPTAEQVFPGDSEMARLMRATDWSRTPLGPLVTWSASLRMAVNLCLSSRFPIVLWWGPKLSVFYNDAYRPSLGASKHPALGKSGREVWPEVWPTIGPLLEGVMANGASTLSEDQLLPLDRYGYLEEVYFTYAYTPIRLETGAVGGVFCTVTETTAKVRAERRMRAGRDLAAALVDARTPEEVCERAAHVLASDAADLPFALLYLLDAGSHCARLAGSVGLERGAKLAPPSLELSGESGEGAPWPLEQVVRTNQREEVADLAARWGGETVHARRELTPHTAMVLPVTEPGQPSPSAILVAGVSPMRAPDDDYEGFFELLVSHLSSGLTAAHAYEEERRRAEALAAIDRAKTAFFSNVSHEFRTPLTLLLGPLEESLADTGQPLPPRQRERLEVMRRNGLRLLKLVNTLLDFARIEAGRVQATYEPVDLAAYTAELASSFRSLIEKAGMQLVVDCPTLGGALREPVYVDRSMWEKIVLNLLSNAFKFTFDGAIRVTVRPLDDGDAAELTVRDTGTGIPAAELPRLFERFHRVEGARARTHEGSGIGLALVQELVHLHGGTIRAESAEGAGTTFSVRLPVGKAHLPANLVQPAEPAATLASTALGATPFVEEAGRWLPDSGADGWSERPDADEMASGATMAEATLEDQPAPQRQAAPARILVADDNADMRDYLRRLLGKRYVVEAVANGAQALAAIRRDAHALPDLVVADVMMPELDGFGLLRALRGDPRTAMLPVMLLSARAGEEATIEGLQAGADDYLVKPFSAREVLNRVAARLEIARTRAEAARRMDEFLGIASHELRTPLTSITANVQLAVRQLRGVSQPGAVDGYEGTLNRLERSAMLLERTNRQLARLDRLVGDLVDVSRIQAGKLELRPEPCNLAEIVREAVREQRTAWPRRNITLSLPRRASVPIYADADRIGQVVTNLLTNALKYSTDDRPVAVRLLARRDSARVEVQDQGPGLTPEQQAHLFERFYRVSGIRQRSGSGVGLGLGLHICKSIVERHGGQVGVESLPGQGSTFWFTLPLADRVVDRHAAGA